ncbi:MAG: beta-galactosidase [Pseudomonadota bacterium]
MSVPQVPFGAVYFRKSNPPREDWERDYGVAAADGLNTFRHWFMWNVIERRPGVYDWDDYDRHLDLAAENGLKTIVAEMSMTTPDWAIRKYPDAVQVFSDGRRLASVMSQSSATPGFGRHNGSGSGVLTFNHPDVKEAAAAFLTELASRYRGHPGLWGYDVWNECGYSAGIDYSEPTKEAYRNWLKDKYGTLDALAPIWHRYSYAEWEDVEPPEDLFPYAEGLDWIKFKRDNNYAHMQFRIDTIKAADPDALILAHGVAGFVTDMASRGADDWLAASKVDVYGYTWIQARRGAQPWRNFFPADLIRGASRGKPFWHAERQGGPLWMQPQVLGRDKEDGRVAQPEDIRVWCMSSFAGGAVGMMNLRYRPLLNGPLFGAFGSYGMDGSRTPRSAMVAEIGHWANDPAQKPVFDAKPVQGDIGILVVPEVQEFDYLLSAEAGFDTYAAAMFGAYQGFFDNNILVDWVHIDDIDIHHTLYFPYPIMLTEAQARKISDWVAKGGTLISEACPGYFGDHGVVGTTQPNHGLEKLFGVREHDVEFMPDIADRYRFVFKGLTVTCGGFLQSYEMNGGSELAHFEDGRCAVVDHKFGQGRTLLVGSHPSVAYHRSPETEERRYFRKVLDWSGRNTQIECSNDQVQCRLARGEDLVLWIINPTSSKQVGEVSLRDWHGGDVKLSWGASKHAFDGRQFRLSPKDAVVARLSLPN